MYELEHEIWTLQSQILWKEIMKQICNVQN